MKFVNVRRIERIEHWDNPDIQVMIKERMNSQVEAEAQKQGLTPEESDIFEVQTGRFNKKGVFVAAKRPNATHAVVHLERMAQ